MVSDDKENPTTSGSGSLLPVSAPRRRALEWTENAEGIMQHEHDMQLQQQQEHQQQQPHNNRSPRKRVNSMMRYFGPRGGSINRWLLGLFMLFLVSTIFMKIMLMSSIVRLNARMKSRDFLRRPQPLEAATSQATSSDDMNTIDLVTSKAAPGDNNVQLVPPLLHQETPDIWKEPGSGNFVKCIGRSKRKLVDKEGKTNGYVIVRANGGLNQMKTGISDMVAITKLLNATLILPSLDHNSFWTDPSDFKDIFDWKHFMEALRDDIEVLESLPPKFSRVKPMVKTLVSWSKPRYYRGDILSILKKRNVLEFPLSDNRLANNGVPSSIQRLRCYAMFEALRFAEDIEELGKTLVSRLREKGERYIALHLRYEKDMLAFTGCNHNLSKAQSIELRTLRHKTRHWKEKHINGTARRLEGGCPMTPREAAMFLEALGYPSSTKIYIVAGEIFGQRLDVFKDKYPNTFSHSTLATPKELEPFRRRLNKLAAVDYKVALESDVFVYTYDGNMAKAVRGHRIFEGFRKTINPDKQSFVRLIDELDKKLISWKEFSSQVKRIHKDRIGAPFYRQVRESPKIEENFYANPLPGCVCEN